MEPIQHFLFVVRCKQHIGQNPQHTGLLDVPFGIADGEQRDRARFQRNGNDRPYAKPLVQVVLRRIGFFCRLGIRNDHRNTLTDSLYPPIQKFSGFIFFGQKHCFVRCTRVEPPERCPQVQIKINLNQPTPVSIVELTGSFQHLLGNFFRGKTPVIQLRF